MTTRAYQEIYLSKAQSVLGDAFDYAVNTCEIPGEDFIKFFTASSVSKRMENGEPAFLAGKSGIEIAVDVVLDATGKHLDREPQEHMGRSREYWIGWAVCYYQWYSARSFSDIFKVLSFVRQIDFHIEITFQIWYSEKIHFVSFIYLIMLFLLHHHYL